MFDMVKNTHTPSLDTNALEQWLQQDDPDRGVLLQLRPDGGWSASRTIATGEGTMMTFGDVRLGDTKAEALAALSGHVESEAGAILGAS